MLPWAIQVYIYPRVWTFFNHVRTAVRLSRIRSGTSVSNGSMVVLWPHLLVARTPSINRRNGIVIVIVLAIRQCAAWASTLITHKHPFPERRKPRKQRKGAWSPPSESTFGLNSYQVSTGLVVILVWYEVVRKCQVRCTWYVISMYHIPGTYRRVGWGAWQAPSSVQPIKDTVAVAKTSDSW